MWTIWSPISSRLRKNEHKCRDDRRLLWTAGCAGLHRPLTAALVPCSLPVHAKGDIVAGRELARRVGSRCHDPPSRRPLCSPGWIDEIAPLVLEVRLVQMGLLRLLTLLPPFSGPALRPRRSCRGIPRLEASWRERSARRATSFPTTSSSIRTSAPRPSSRWLLTLRSRSSAFARSFRRPMQRCRT